MSIEQPSKYHHRCYGGKSEQNPSGYEWLWNSSHPDLEPTETVNIEGQHYCVYCAKKAYPIQAGLRKDRWGNKGENYDTTGYCCICESAEKERELKHRLTELHKKQEEEEYKLRKEYKDILKHDKKGLLEIEYKTRLRRIDWEESR